ncbi:MAG: hypothetical protein H6592_10425 [Flavobacteriales bacterium]|nr:hypothetical protein [Flavobacteriales bacterium]
MAARIGEKINTYRLPSAGYFPDYNEKLIFLLKQVCTARVRTQDVVRVTKVFYELT